jgi:hypothetical protein
LLLAVPLMMVVKVICEHVEPLHLSVTSSENDAGDESGR